MTTARDSPMSILLLALDVDLSRERGDAVHTRELAKSLAARGNRVELVTAAPADPIGPNVAIHLRPIGGDLAIVRGCAGIARNAEAQVIYERRLSPKIAFGVSGLTGLPFVVEVNGTEVEATIQGHAVSSPWRPVRQRLRRTMYGKAARVVAVTEGLASYVREETRLPPERITVVPNGVDSDRFAPIPQSEARRRVGLAEGPYIVFVGNLVPWQGIEVMVRAMPAVRRAHPAAKFVIVGDGMLRPVLESLAAELAMSHAVMMTGTVPHGDVPAYISAGDVCVAPFTRLRNEAIGLSPLKVYEYMACGRPVVASAIPGIRELLERSGGGVVADPDDPEAFGAAVSRSLSHPDEARSMGEAGRRHAIAECTWAKTAERVEVILRASIGGG